MSELHKRSGLTVVEGLDTRTITIRQSWLSTYLTTCSWRAMQESLGRVPRTTSDASGIGTAIHAGIEALLRSWKEEHHDLGVRQLMQVPGLYDLAMVSARAELAELLPEMTFVKYDNPENVVRLVEDAVHNFWCYRLPHLSGPPLGIEVPFDIPVKDEDGLYLRFRGTIDAVFSRTTDWKTSGKPWDRKKKNHSNVQAPIYDLAVSHLFGEQVERGEVHFVVMLHDVKPGRYPTQLVPVQVTEDKINWVVEEAWKVARLVDSLGQGGYASLAPKDDDHGLCKPEWCPLFTGCKGLTPTRKESSDR